MGNKIQRIVIGKPGWTIDIEDCAYAVQMLSQIARGWQIKETQPTRSNPKVRIGKSKSGWTWQSFGRIPPHKPNLWVKRPPHSDMRILNDLHECMIYWYLEDNPDILTLHCAGVHIGEGVVCFPARGRAGKSTLMAALSQRGIKIFGDDVLMVKNGRAMSYGFSPRLRTPIPENLSANLKSYISSQTICAADKVLHLNPGEANWAKLGELKPFGSFVLLDRKDSGPAIISETREVDVLKSLVLENIVTRLPMTTIFDRMRRLSSKKPGYTLTYSDTDEAANLLISKLGSVK